MLESRRETQVSRERRQHPRVLAAQPIEAYVIEAETLVRVIDVSTGGIGGISPGPIPVGGIVTCEIRSNGVGAIRIAATPVYCRPHAGDADAFEVGFAFVDPSHALTQATAGALLEHVTSVLEFDEPTIA